jgi:hypothetical protein
VNAGLIASLIALAIFVAGLAVLAVAVIRSTWRFWRGDFEPESGGSHGRQLFDRRRQKT